MIIVLPRSGAIRHLHCFPTRRSSDLHADAGGAARGPAASALDLRSVSPVGASARSTRRGAARHRSEEHTSELQSPCNLVCRLLLEKKETEQIIVAER